MITLLVCGSTGFVMSNFCRWILYRSKDFNIIGVDTIEDRKDFETLYIHKNYRFYVGDAGDLDFIKKVCELHKPDIIINSINSVDVKTKVKNIQATQNLLSLNIPLIQLSNAPAGDPLGIWNCINKLVLQNKNTVLEFPNCFGRRQKAHSGLAKIIKIVRDSNEVGISPEELPWVFVEDVASIIWYVIEKQMKGLVRMPALGYYSIPELVEIISNKLSKKIETKKTLELMWPEVCLFYNVSSQFGDWSPENTDIKGLIENTIDWYSANRWAL